MNVNRKTEENPTRMSEIVDKQPYFRKKDGTEVLVIDMSTPELLDAQKFCKSYLERCKAKKVRAERDLEITEKQRARTENLFSNISKELKKRKVVKNTELKQGDTIMIRGKGHIFEVQDPGDLDIDAFVKKGKVFKYD
jgi:hypothetical protein